MVARRSLALATALALAVAGAAGAASLQSLRDHRRVVLMFAPRADDPALQRQLAQARPLAQAPDDRDLVLVQVVGDRVEGLDDPAQVLRRRFGAPADRFAVVLVGKDGHAALRSNAPVSGARLGATIDSMPMREEEMRRRGG